MFQNLLCARSLCDRLDLKPLAEPFLQFRDGMAENRSGPPFAPLRWSDHIFQDQPSGLVNCEVRNGVLRREADVFEIAVFSGEVIAKIGCNSYEIPPYSIIVYRL